MQRMCNEPSRSDIMKRKLGPFVFEEKPPPSSCPMCWRRCTRASWRSTWAYAKKCVATWGDAAGCAVRSKGSPCWKRAG